MCVCVCVCLSVCLSVCVCLCVCVCDPTELDLVRTFYNCPALRDWEPWNLWMPQETGELNPVCGHVAFPHCTWNLFDCLWQQPLCGICYLGPWLKVMKFVHTLRHVELTCDMCVRACMYACFSAKQPFPLCTKPLSVPDPTRGMSQSHSAKVLNHNTEIIQ